MRNLIKSSVSESRSAFSASLMCCLIAGLSTAKADNEVYKKALPSTVWVLAKSGGETSTGTGVLIDAEKKLVITNSHVVGEARAAVLFFPDMKNGSPVVTRKHYLDNVKSTMEYVARLTRTAKNDLAPREDVKTAPQTLDAWLAK